MKRLTIKCVVCIMFGIAYKNNVIRHDSNSYLGQQNFRFREHEGRLMGHAHDL